MSTSNNMVYLMVVGGKSSQHIPSMQRWLAENNDNDIPRRGMELILLNKTYLLLHIDVAIKIKFRFTTLTLDDLHDWWGNMENNSILGSVVIALWTVLALVSDLSLLLPKSARLVMAGKSPNWQVKMTTEGKVGPTED